MERIDKKIRTVNLWVLLLYNTAMIFYTIVPKPIVIILSIMFYVYFFWSTKRIYGIKLALIFCVIASLPTSFTSVMATSYGELPINWFSIFVILTMCYILTVEKVNAYYIILLFLYVAFFIASLFRAHDMGESISQGLTIMLLLFSFPIGYNLAKKPSKDIFETMQQTYLFSVLAFSLQIVIQMLVLLFVRQVIGTYATMASRVAYAGLFGDYSFASLYIATGILLLFILFFEQKTIGLLRFIVLEGIMLIALILTTARTGLYTVVVLLAIYICTRLKQFNWKVASVLLGICFAVPVFAEKFLELRGNGNLFDDSGRMETYNKALIVFLDNFLMGIGFGIGNWKAETGFGIPHNFLIQYLGQFGIIGFTILLLFFRKFLGKYYKFAKQMKWLMILVLAGGMFIPDIASSRFFTVIIIMYMIEAKVNKEQT